MKKYVADSETRTMAKSGDSANAVIQRCIETVAHASACSLGAACPRQPECKKMTDVLRHARACTLRMTCTVCQQLMALCITHARACTVDSSTCHIPFCAELRRHIQRRQTLQRHQQHQMDDRRRAVMTGTSVGNNDFDDKAETYGSNSGKGCTGKGGERAEKSISADVSVNISNPANVTTDQAHLKTNTDDSCVAVADSSALLTSETKTSNCSISHADSTCTVVSMPNSAVPKTATSSIGDRTLAENQSVGDRSTASEVLQTTESFTRHQMVVGCLRMLKKLNPSMSKQNLLQLLCHCSRQQLTALHDKVDSL